MKNLYAGLWANVTPTDSTLLLVSKVLLTKVDFLNLCYDMLALITERSGFGPSVSCLSTYFMQRPCLFSLLGSALMEAWSCCLTLVPTQSKWMTIALPTLREIIFTLGIMTPLLNAIRHGSAHILRRLILFSVRRKTNTNSLGNI